MRRLLFLSGYGLGLTVSQGCLLAGGHAYLPGAHNLSAVIVSGRAGVRFAYKALALPLSYTAILAAQTLEAV